MPDLERRHDRTRTQLPLGMEYMCAWSVNVGIDCYIYMDNICRKIQIEKIGICTDLATCFVRPRVLESVYQERSMKLPVGFVRLNRYVINDVIVHDFTVQYNIYDSWDPELHRFSVHHSHLCVVTRSALQKYP